GGSGGKGSIYPEFSIDNGLEITLKSTNYEGGVEIMSSIGTLSFQSPYINSEFGLTNESNGFAVVIEEGDPECTRTEVYKMTSSGLYYLGSIWSEVGYPDEVNVNSPAACYLQYPVQKGDKTELFPGSGLYMICEGVETITTPIGDLRCVVISGECTMPVGATFKVYLHEKYLQVRAETRDANGDLVYFHEIQSANKLY
ncbi:hypothetical protein ACFL56_03270, partial [Candidatus Margulisiibacteriota bacterium]